MKEKVKSIHDRKTRWAALFVEIYMLFGLFSEVDLPVCTGEDDPFKNQRLLKKTREKRLTKGVAEKLFVLRMAKVYPRAPAFSPFVASERRSFTIWMKSLVCHTNGCTVFDSNGDVIYRVDNYGEKCKSEVFLMDLRGKVLFTIRKKRLQLFGRWDGYRCGGSNKDEKPCFKVEKLCRILMGDFSCRITAGLEKYWMVRVDGKTSFRIIDIHGSIMAEGKRKLSSSGELLGDDVLGLEVKPETDHSLVMAFILVYGLITRQL